MKLNSQVKWIASQVKWIAFLIGGIGTVVAIAATTVQAQFPPSTSMPFPPQNGGSMPSSSGDGAFPSRDDLDLTEEQEEEIAEINEGLKDEDEIEGILSDDQLEELQEAVDNGEDMRQVVNELDLSDDQESDLREAFQSAQQQISEALTSE